MLFLLVLAVSTSIVTGAFYTVLRVQPQVADRLPADPNDWISVDYVAHGAKGADTSAARQRILSMAGSTASKGPWSKPSLPSREKHRI